PLPCVFFCQAEDGIRDFHVTGVQTCALPILEGHGTVLSVVPELDHAHVRLAVADIDPPGGYRRLAPVEHAERRETVAIRRCELVDRKSDVKGERAGRRGGPDEAGEGSENTGE